MGSRVYCSGRMKLSSGLLVKGLVLLSCLLAVSFLWRHLYGWGTQLNAEHIQSPEMKARFDVHGARQEVYTGLCVVIQAWLKGFNSI